MLKKTYNREIFIPVETIVITFLILILFDGIFRLIADVYGIHIINAWKDFFILAFLFSLSFSIFLIRKRLILTTWDLLFVIFSIVVIPVGIYYHGLIQTIWGIKIFIIPILFYILLFNLFLPQSMDWSIFKKFIIANLIVYIPIFIYALLQYFTKFEILKWLSINPSEVSYINVTFIGKTLRAIGTFRNQFNFGNYSAYVAIFSFEGILLSRRISSKIIFFLFFTIALVGVFISTSRSSLLLVIYVMLALLFLTYLRKHKTVLRILLIGLVIILPIMVMYVALYKLGVGKQQFFLFSTLSTVSRLFVWTHAITHFPFYSSPITLIFGYGVGAIGGAQALVGDPNWNPVDNIFLYFLINFGLFGTFILFYLLLAPVMKYIKEIDRIRPNWLDIVVALTLAIVFAQGMFATFFDGFPLPYLFWFMHFFFRLKSKELISGESQ